MTLAEEMGLLRWRDLEARGMPRSELQLRVRMGSLTKVARGLWRPYRFEFPAAAVAARRVPRGVLCLKTALWVHGLSREEPDKVWMAIDEKARKPRWEEPPLQVVRFSGLALSEGIEYRSIHGVQVPVYSVAKTVADLFKYRGKLGYPIAVRALGDALLTGRCSQEELLRFAGICRVGTSMAPYLEVIRARRGPDLARAEQARVAREAERESSRAALRAGPLPGTEDMELE
ncbi:type IV toxin-antitoxin system AbiEi family antitoxin domain-containing protein [Pyxidicoccus sp. MSG2]|uniref:type IV toxin-antitoxin system AbiEi family antitoxin domain-containing protein n=1 Tax=Pyxidicoccus sp. MSG2 TaxID=2996790 RepID=UPI00226EFEE8|nr:type IV toxin-antitoxin system AbiEi family antitoxin domain-containing protein [Pyxidicoccus sp. MSG2]MCY1017268.1 type IV toxin-antitoxin system AbiEi family antitoxin domain-containing protein [Pyxidicoccus sp. MSG2]